ncbi:MAG: efflux RND transporter periplasmic adaptor subunit [Prolixibacteraceae bacterium]|jgi:membrane fusion protein (multidrug efflux system)|nr:efflux RND transporter periplasmic adaptor subunit [Prolixibacteraceae bacterium]
MSVLDVKKGSLSCYVLIGVSLLGLVACKKQVKKSARPLPRIPVVEVIKENVTVKNRYPATVQGSDMCTVRSKISAYITAIHVEEGEWVRAGQRLFSLETDALDMQAKAAAASVQEAKIQVSSLKPLVEANVVSGVQLKTAEAKYRQAVRNYENIKAQIAYADVKSPIAGVVGRIPYKKGNLVSPSNALGLTTISDIDSVDVYFSMSEKTFLSFVEEMLGNDVKAKIATMPQVELIMANEQSFGEMGIIKSVSGDINRTTGSLRLKARFPNSHRLVRDGSSGQIIIPKVRMNTMVVPAMSVIEEQGKSYVYRVLPDSTIDKIAVKVGVAANRKIEILNILTEGDKIVALGQKKIKPNMKIIPVDGDMEMVTNAYQTVFK